MYPSELGELNFGRSEDFDFLDDGAPPRPLDGTNRCLSGSKSSGSAPVLAPPLEKLPPREGVNLDDSSSISYSETK